MNSVVDNDLHSYIDCEEGKSVREMEEAFKKYSLPREVGSFDIEYNIDDYVIELCEVFNKKEDILKTVKSSDVVIAQNYLNGFLEFYQNESKEFVSSLFFILGTKMNQKF